MKVERCGVNLLDLSPNNVESGIYNNGGKSDGAAGQQRTITPIMVNPKQALIYTTDSRLKYNVRATFFSAAGEYLSNIGLTPDTVFNVPDNAHQMFIHSNGYGLIGNNAPWYEISVGTTPPTTYAPYTGQTTTLTLPRTIYGGEVNAVTGAGQETWKLITLDGTENWYQENSATKNYACNIKLPANPLTECFCNILPWKLYSYASAGNEGYFAFESSGQRVHFCTTETWETVDDWKAYLAAQYAAGTPVQIAYKLATPVPFAATGGGTIKALSGTNTVLTDADKATVKGYEDLPHAINEMRQAVVAAAEGV